MQQEKMITLTKNNAKERCRTCLRKLIKNEYEDAANTENDKNNFVCITSNSEICELLDKYVGSEGSSGAAHRDEDYPLNVCIECVKQLQTFETFRKKALDSAEKLYRVFTSDVHKIELDDDGMESKDVVREQLIGGKTNENDVFNLLLKDSLMETEAILLEGTGTDNVANSLDPDPFQTDTTDNRRKCRGRKQKETSTNEKTSNQSAKPTRRSRRGKDADETKSNEIHSSNNITVETLEGEGVAAQPKPETQNNLLKSDDDDDDDENKSVDNDIHDWPLDFQVEYSDSSTDNEVLSKRIQRLRSRANNTKKKTKKSTKVEVGEKSEIDIDSDFGLADAKENEEQIKTSEFNNGGDEHSSDPENNDMYDDFQPSDESDSDGLSTESEFDVGGGGKEKKKSSTTSTKKRSAASGRKKGLTNSYKCEQCNRRFGHKITLDAHVRKIHQGEKRAYKCELCDKSYSFMGGLTTHMRETHERQEESYECKIPGCEKKYTSYITLQRHVRVKHLMTEVPTRYVCEQCGATFKQTSNLRYHMRTRHPTEDDLKLKEIIKERLECEICKKFFNSQYTLKYHKLRIHADDKKYECKICGRRVAKQFMLDQHMLVHSEDKTACKFCGREFVRKYQVEAHIKAVHQKLKPHQCPHCSESFASRKTLRHHIYIHTGEKPYVCDICGQAYRQPTCLKNHRKIHNKNVVGSTGNDNGNNNNNGSIQPQQTTDTMTNPPVPGGSIVTTTSAVVADNHTSNAMNINRNFINNLMQGNDGDAAAMANSLDLQITMNFLFNINVCRVCMQNEKGSDLLSNTDLLEKFSYTTGLTVNEKDNLPKIICSKCIARLKVAHSFIKSAQESENNLKTFLAKINNEFHEVTKAKKPADTASKNCEDDVEHILTEDDILIHTDEEGNDDDTSSKITAPTKKPNKSSKQKNSSEKLEPRSLNSKPENNDGNKAKKRKRSEDTEPQPTVSKFTHISLSDDEDENVLIVKSENKQQELEKNDSGEEHGNLNISNKNKGKRVEENLILELQESITKFTENEESHHGNQGISYESQESVFIPDDIHEQLGLESVEKNNHEAQGTDINLEDILEIHHNLEEENSSSEAQIHDEENEETAEYEETLHGFAINEDATHTSSTEFSELGLEENHEQQSLVQDDINAHNEEANSDGYLQEYETMNDNPASDTIQYNADDCIETHSRAEISMQGNVIYKENYQVEKQETEDGHNDCNEEDNSAAGDTNEEISHVYDDQRTDYADYGFSTASNNGDIKNGNRRTSTATAAATVLKIKSSLAIQPRKTNRFYCEQCDRDFSSKTNLNRHMQSHQGTKPHQCPQCPKSFTQKSTLKQHLLTHTGEKPYICDICDRGFTQCKSLIFHKRRHTGEKPFQCEFCLFQFRQKDALRMHLLKYHVLVEQTSDGSETYTCIICEKKFFSKDDFNTHMKIHTVIETDKTGEQLIVHTNDEYVNAAVTDTSASSASEPQRAKKFQCRICFKCFALKKSLLRHMTIHNDPADDLDNSLDEYNDEFSTEYQQFACSACPNLIFKSIEELKMHMLEHDLEQQQD
ncbi:uncharacterized protein [Musca autumnalis]|uniref:uncharacterized protein n=1 Tax=Musca autumnalis TaxID=221902 RepID=UPI003CF11BCC